MSKRRMILRISGLPESVMGVVFSFLDKHSLAECTATCPTWRRYDPFRHRVTWSYAELLASRRSGGIRKHLVKLSNYPADMPREQATVVRVLDCDRARNNKEDWQNWVRKSALAADTTVRDLHATWEWHWNWLLSEYAPSLSIRRDFFLWANAPIQVALVPFLAKHRVEDTLEHADIMTNDSPLAVLCSSLPATLKGLSVGYFAASGVDTAESMRRLVTRFPRLEYLRMDMSNRPETKRGTDDDDFDSDDDSSTAILQRERKTIEPVTSASMPHLVTLDYTVRTSKLYEDYTLSTSGLGMLIAAAPCLTHLRFKYITLSRDDAQRIVHACPKLQALRLGMQKSAGSALDALDSLAELEHLRFLSFHIVPDDVGYSQDRVAFADRPSPWPRGYSRLEELDIDLHCHHVDGELSGVGQCLLRDVPESLDVFSFELMNYGRPPKPPSTNMRNTMVSVTKRLAKAKTIVWTGSIAATVSEIYGWLGPEGGIAKGVIFTRQHFDTGKDWRPEYTVGWLDKIEPIK